MITELLAITGVAVHEDGRSYRTYPFDVPAGTASLYLTFSVEPARVGPYGQAVGMALYSPAGFRGTPGRGPQPARIGVDGATPGFLPGPLGAGTWTAEVSLGYVLEGPPCTYRLRVWAEEEAAPRGQPLPARSLPAAIPDTGPRWYAGDLHMHTHHSDGRWSVEELWQAVRERGLDFFVLTDHNTASGLAELAAPETGRTLPIPGVEVTTLAGHLVAAGIKTPVDWRLWREGRTAADILRDVHAAGGLAIIAHPGAEPSPVCHGCRWDLHDVDPGQVDAVEVWNSPWTSGDAEDNERSLLFWEAWLARGYRTPLSGGSDAHGGLPTFAAGVPTTYVYARELSRQAILDGIRAGRVVVSSGPALRLVGHAGGATVGPGEILPAQGPLALEATVAGLEAPARLSLVGNGTVLAETVVSADGGCRHVIEEPARGWYRADLRGLDGGEMLAITSPVYVDG